jgi:hypothetical protein
LGPIFLGGLLFVVVFVFLAVFARGGPTETHRVGARSPDQVLSALSLDELSRVSTRILNEMGFRIIASTPTPTHVDVIADDPTPITGQRVYVRILPAPPGGFVESVEVQAAMDAARGEGLSKAIVLSPAQFSEEARSTAMDVQLELIGGSELEDLCRRYVLDVAARLGPPRE